MTISIHAPREGGDWEMDLIVGKAETFQSTPPARGATERIRAIAAELADFNPRPPRGGRLSHS